MTCEGAMIDPEFFAAADIYLNIIVGIQITAVVEGYILEDYIS